MKLLSGLNESQRAAVTSTAPVILTLAGAGSGKTRTLTHRVAYLHQERRVGTTNMLCLTFTRLAGKEMKERVRSLIGETEAVKLFCNTFHAFAVSVLKEWGARLKIDRNFSIYDEEDRRSIMEAIIADFGKKTTLAKVMERFSLCQDFREERVVHPEECRVLEEYGYRLRRNNAVDLDRLIDLVNYLWAQHPDVLEHYRKLYKYVFVDEFQDTNDEQMEMLRLLNPENLFIVGDDFQCQHPGTIVDTPKGPMPIEQLRDGDEVLAWHRKSQYVTSTGYKIKVAARPYVGNIIRVCADGFRTKATPNHKFLVRWTNRDHEKYVTYIMYRQDRGYRVGWCQLFTQQGALHVTARARLEKADALWILAIHSTKQDASIHESIVSMKYGIPTCMFEPNGELYNEHALQRIFAHAKPEEAERCLRESGFDPGFPFWPYPNRRDNTGRPTYFECYACNLFPNHMSVPLPGDRDNPNQWAVIASLRRHHYSGPVYSLDVEKHHNYVADGIVTLNSIYGWRGANVDHIITYPEKYPETEVHKLQDNYRSTSSIIRAANSLISNNTKQTEKTLIPHKDGREVFVKAWANEFEEAQGVALMIRETYEAKSPLSRIAVLARTNAQVERMKRVLDTMNIPAQLVAGSADPFRRQDVKLMFAWLDVYQNRKDTQNLKKILNWPKQYFTQMELQKMEFEATARDISLLDVIANYDTKHRFLDALTILEGMIAEAQAWTPSQCLLQLVKALGIEQLYWEQNLKNRMADAEAAYAAMLRWEKSRKDLGEDVSLQAFLKWLRYRDIQERLVADEDAVKLMTVHASKGLEFDTVFLIGMSQGIFPSKRTQDIEEERRLCYVAVTRAENQLVITRPMEVEPSWGGKPYKTERSQFLGEMIA